MTLFENVVLIKKFMKRVFNVRKLYFILKIGNLLLCKTNSQESL